MAPAQTEAQSRIEAWFVARRPWSRRGLAFLAGALATLGHAPFQIVPAYVLAITTLVWLLDFSARQERRIRSAMATSFFFGLGHFLTGLYWVASAFLVDPQLWGWAPGLAAALALSGGMALFWMIGGGLAMPLWTQDARRLPVFAIAFFVVEWLRGNILTGLPWLLPGYIWTPGEPISQFASVVGIYGLSAITLLVCAAPATLADAHANTARRFAPTVVAGLVLGLLWGWGVNRLTQAPVDLPGAQPIIRVADSGLSQAEKWRPRQDQAERVLSLYLRASGIPDEDRAQVVIWPEGAIPSIGSFILDSPQLLREIGRGMGDRTLILGLTRCAPSAVECEQYMEGLRSDSGLHFYNSAAVIDGVSGVARVSQTYDKHHLVPGGEYIPFWSIVRNLNIRPLQQIGAGFDAGPLPTRLVVPDAPPAVILICYESIFPGMVPRGVDRPGWIVNISNDAWFGDLDHPVALGPLTVHMTSTGPWQAYEMARYRAIEEGLPLARSASGGVSAIVDSFGRQVRSTHGSVLYAEAQLPHALAETIFARWSPLSLLLVLVLIGALRFAPSVLWKKDNE